MTSRTVTWEMSAKDGVSVVFRDIAAAAATAGSTATGAMNALGQSLQLAETHSRRFTLSIRDAGQAMHEAGGHASFLKDALSSATGFLGAEVFGRLASGAVDAGKSMVTLAANGEQLQLSFTTLDGSAKGAKDEIAALQKLGIESPFSLEDFAKGAQQLQIMGANAQQAQKELTDLGNITAASGRTGADLEGAAVALGKMNAQYVAHAKYLNELVSHGVPAWNALAEATGKSVPQVMDLVRQNQVLASTVDDALSTYSKNHGLDDFMVRSQNNMQGLMNSLGDLGGAFGRALGGPVIAAAEPYLIRLVAYLQTPQVTATLADWGDKLGKITNWLLQGVTAAGQFVSQLTTLIRPVTDLIGGLIDQLPSVSSNLSQAAPVAAQLGDGLQTAADAGASLKDTTAGLRDDVANLHDQEAAINAGYDNRIALVRDQQAAVNAADENKLSALRNQESSLQRQYELQNKQLELSRLGAAISDDKALAGDIFSSAGQAARQRLVGEQQRFGDLQRGLTETQAKDAIQVKIAGVEAEKRADDQRFAAQLRNLENEKRADDQRIQSRIRGLEATIRADQAAARSAAETASAEAASAATRITAAARIADMQSRMQEGLDAVRLAAARHGTEISRQPGLLEAFRLKLVDLMGLSGLQGVITTWNMWMGALHTGMPLVTEITGEIGKLAQTLGVDKALDLALKTTAKSVDAFFQAWLRYLPQFSGTIGAALNVAAQGLLTVIKTADVGATILQQLAQGKLLDPAGQAAIRQTLTDLGAQIVRDQAAVRGVGAAAGNYPRTPAPRIVDSGAGGAGNTPDFGARNAPDFGPGSPGYVGPVRPQSSGGGNTYNFHFNGFVGDQAAIVRAISEQMAALHRAAGAF